MNREVLNQYDLEPESQVAPPEVFQLVYFLPGARAKQLRFLVENFGKSVIPEHIYSEDRADFPDNWEENLQVNLNRIREVLPASVALYIFQKHGRYMLDLKREIGSWFVPDFRALDVVKIPEEIREFFAFCSQFEVTSSIRLKSRLSRTELGIVKPLVSAYSELVSHQTLFQNTNLKRKETLWVNISRTRDKIEDFRDSGGGRFDIDPVSGFGYRLARVED